ncbi:MAG: efflux transporter outer membrane subunit [Crocinitomicaceae bacterium]|jgi:NodT family efflux transporter outer membrane factor (OMF) lipoprotein|nr:efflux transporter outer membrane subunit [Crocinitomicaceae bacterium]
MEPIIFKRLGMAAVVLAMTACSSLNVVQKEENSSVPESFIESTDTLNSAKIQWRDYFNDPYLVSLIDSALVHNQELNITLQEIEIARNEVMARKGEFLPFLNGGAASGVEKPGRYTSKGANDATTDIKPGVETPDPLPDFMLGVNSTWEVDIWRKLRNSRDAAFRRFMGTVEGKNFLVTQLVAEIASDYYELLALDNQLAIIQRNIAIQSDALEIVRLQKTAARVTELAVKRFEAQLFNTKSLQYEIRQRIIETENHLNFLVGRFPQRIQRTQEEFVKIPVDSVYYGVPSQLLQNRPDIRMAELELQACKLDIKVARAQFYPSLRITAGLGFQAFNPAFLLQAPESMLYNLAGDVVGPLINRKALKAAYFNANAKQIQAVYNYEKAILNAFIEVSNQVNKVNNLQSSFELQSQQVDRLTESITISNNLFKSARADYMEVLLTQRDALESKFELIDTKRDQLKAKVNVYKALGGGWN